MRVLSLRNAALLVGISLAFSTLDAQTSPSATTTTLAVTAGGSPVTTISSGTAITLTATVQSSGVAVSPGLVNFCDATAVSCTDIHLLGTAQLTGAGTATVRLVPPSGNRGYRAQFVGSNSFGGSSSATSLLTVVPVEIYPTSTTFSQLTTGATYSLTATVVGTGTATPPTGNVSFLDTSNGNSLLGTGTLAVATQQLTFGQVALPFAGSSYAVGDFNNDGKLDLAARNLAATNTGTVTILLNGGNGTFVEGASVMTGDAPITPVVADFNGDGNEDLAVVNRDVNGGVTILLGNGDGTFTPANAIPYTGYYPSAAAAGDFNGDGNVDLAVAYNGGGVTLLLGNGQGSFTPTAPTALQDLVSDVNQLLVADFNNDGHADLVEVGSQEGFLFLGDGNGGFSEQPQLYSFGPPAGLNASVVGVSVADFNGDGIPDLMIGYGYFPYGSQEMMFGADIMFGKGDGTFPKNAFPLVANQNFGTPESAIVGDFNGDGKLDVGMTVTPSYPGAASVGLVIAFGNGDGTFSSTNFVTSGISYTTPVVGDFNGDGTTDFIAARGGQLAVQLSEILQTATTTVNGISTPGPETQMAEASYSGGGSYLPSASSPVLLQPRALATLSQTNLTFGNQNLDTESSLQTVTLTNTGNLAMTINKVAFTGSYASSFVAGNTCGTSLGAGAACTIRVNFYPQAVGLLSSSLNITDNAGDSPQSITASGTGIGPAVTLSSNSVTFANQNVNTPSAAQMVTLTNSGSAALAVSSITATGANAASFLVSSNCIATIAISSSCTINLTFDPKFVGTGGAIVTIIDNAPTSPQSISVTGTGSGPVATFSATSVPFGDQNVGVESAQQVVSLTNTGTAPLIFTSIALTGANPSSFLSTNNCPTTLPVASSCNFYVNFSPQTAGLATAALTITDNAATLVQTITLTGTGNGPAAIFSATSMAFGNQAVGTASGIQTVTLTNSGTAPLSITSIALAGASPLSFHESNSCGTTLAASASCAIIAKFYPTVPGPVSATIVITDNAATSPQTITLSGTGTGPGATLSATSMAFGDQAVGTASGIQTVTLTNSGTAPLSITSIALAGASPLSFHEANSCGATLAASASCAIIAKFYPTVDGNVTATIEITDNAAGSPQSIALTGTGTGDGPAVSLSATSLSFGSLSLNTESPAQSVTVTNVGGASLGISGLSLTGPDAASFLFSSNCGASLAAGSSCSVDFIFDPILSGGATASFTISDTAASGSQTIALAGAGSGPSVTLSSTSLAFHSPSVGTPSAVQTVTLTNTGASALTVSSISLTGANSASFLSSNNCPSSLAGGAACTARLIFDPAAAGTSTAGLNILVSGSTTPLTVSLTGTIP